MGNVSRRMNMRRRDFVSAVGATIAGVALHGQSAKPPSTGRLKQGVTQGVFARGTSLEDCCKIAAECGIKGFDLIGPDQWPMLKKYGLTPTMYPPGPGGNIPEALNRKENHEKLEPLMHAALDEAAANGVPNIITFSGNRKGTPDAEGADNCVTFLNKVKAHAEDKGVT